MARELTINEIVGVGSGRPGTPGVDLTLNERLCEASYFMILAIDVSYSMHYIHVYRSLRVARDEREILSTRLTLDQPADGNEP